MKSILARLRTWFGQQPSPPAANTTNEAAPGKPRKRPPGAADLQLHSRDAQTAARWWPPEAQTVRH